MSVQLSISVKRPSEPARALHWCAGGVRLWARAPLRLLILSNIPLLVELCLQQIPVAGVLISKLLAPIVTAGVLLGVQSVADGQHLRSGCILAALNPNCCASTSCCCPYLESRSSRRFWVTAPPDFRPRSS